MPEDLSQLREDYTGGSLRRSDLAAEPIAQFKLWFEQARELQVVEPNAMTATRWCSLRPYDSGLPHVQAAS